MNKWIALLVTVLLTSCNSDTVYHQFASIDGGAWDKSEELLFTVERQPEDIIVDEEVGLRIERGRYPYTDICLVIEQTLLPAKSVTTDTMIYSLPEDNGYSARQYDLPFKTLNLHKGDSLQIVIRHNMKEKLLQGVHDVGIRMERIEN